LAHRPELFKRTPEEAFERALMIARSPAAFEVQQMRFAAETLVAFGAVDEADEMIARLEQAGVRTPRLKAVSTHLRRSGILTDYRPVAALQGDDSTGLQEVLVSEARQKTDRVIVVFSGAAKRFWLSLELLNRFLAPHGAHIINLTDYTNMMYFNGLPKTAPGYDRMLVFLRGTAADLGASRLFLMANSGGGFIGLRAAADIGAESFLGLSIRTDFSRRPNSIANDFARRFANTKVDESLLIDMRGYLADKPFPRTGILVCGEGHPVDVAHADNLAALPNFKVVKLSEYGHHDSVSGLLARGQFETVLAEFMGEAAAQ
jgi:hypothetical protein